MTTAADEEELHASCRFDVPALEPQTLEVLTYQRGCAPVRQMLDARFSTGSKSC